MKDLVIFGAGLLAEVAHFYFAHDSPYRVVGFAVDREYLDSDTLFDLPVVPADELQARFPPSSHDVFVALSYTQRNAARAEKCASVRALGYTLPSYVSSKATTWPGFSVGDNCFVLEDNTIQPYVQIGSNVFLWSGNHIGHHSVIEDDCFITSHVVVSGGVQVGRGTFIGVNATIRNHVSIGAGCIIGAGAVILGDCEPDGLYKAAATERAPVSSAVVRHI